LQWEPGEAEKAYNMPSPDLEEVCIVIIVKGAVEIESGDGNRRLTSLAS
jgi:hypothetical protein